MRLCILSVVVCSLLGCATPVRQARFNVPYDAESICIVVINKVLSDFYDYHWVTDWDIETSRKFLGSLVQNDNMPILDATWAIMISARRLTLRLQAPHNNEELGDAIVDIHRSCARGVWGNPPARHNDLSPGRRILHV